MRGSVESGNSGELPNIGADIRCRCYLLQELSYDEQVIVLLVALVGRNVYAIVELVDEGHDQVIEQDDVLQPAVFEYTQVFYPVWANSYTMVSAENHSYPARQLV